MTIEATETLTGKEYLTVREAACYAGLSYSHWRARVQPMFPAAEFCGRLIYRTADVRRFVEQKASWPAGFSKTSAGPHRGRRRGNGD